MVIQRYENWAKKLSDYLHKNADTPFIWGKNDCMLFAAKGVLEMTGVDCFSKYLPYSTEEEAYKILRENGGFMSIISKGIGTAHDKILSAKRGDVALMKMPRKTCGLIDDTGQFIAAPGENGIIRLPLTQAYKIWSI